MIDARRAMLTLATVSLLLAACGGGGGGGGAASAGTGDAPSDPAPAVVEPAAGGGSGGGVCDLITNEELASAFGVPSVKTTAVVGPPDNCIVESDAGKPLAVWSWTTTGGSGLYQAFVLPGQSTEVPGIGDKAAFVDNTGLLVVKGDGILIIGLSSGADLSDDAAKEVQKKLGAYAAGRM